MSSNHISTHTTLSYIKFICWNDKVTMIAEDEILNQEELSVDRLLVLAKTWVPSSSYAQVTKLDLFQCGLSSLPYEMATQLPNLSILFCMKNAFSQVPAVIGSCPNLQMVSFKSNKISFIHPDALQKQMRWLILTDNLITHLPDTISRCTSLQKLMLSGNKLVCLPDSIIHCQNLQLIRLASNQLTESPLSLLRHLKQLAWIALSDNPFAQNDSISLEKMEEPHILNEHDFQDMDEILGSGASGVTRKFLYKSMPVAVKTFSSTITSDGNPMQERRIALMTCTSKSFDALVKVYGILPNGNLVMELLKDYLVFAQPPSMQSCTRDVYEYTQYPHRLYISTVQEAQDMITKFLLLLIHLHELGICHGDFYGHNILISSPTMARTRGSMEGSQEGTLLVKLTDFGASFLYSKKQSDHGHFIECIEVRAFGHLISEIRDMLWHAYKLKTNDMNTTIDIMVRFCEVLDELIEYCHGDEVASFRQLMILWTTAIGQLNL